MSALGHRIETYRDACEQERGLAGWSQEYCQIAAGRYGGRTETLSLGEVTLWREAIGVAVDQRTAPPEGAFIFAMSIRPDAKLRMDAVPLSDDAAVVMRGGRERVVAFGAASDVLIVAVPENALGPTERPVPLVCPPEAATAFDFFASWAVSLLATVGAMEMGSADLATVLPAMAMDRLRYVHGKLLPAPPRRAGGPEADLALYRRALEALADDEAEILTVEALAAAAGTTTDALREAFLRVVGVGPGVWLRSHRLGRARRDLLAAEQTGETVSQIAARWGFWHFGRFARMYADFFGESPSRTSRGGVRG